MVASQVGVMRVRPKLLFILLLQHVDTLVIGTGVAGCCRNAGIVSHI
jgi:hypothetical protein